MGFSPTIREEILVASARHCCACHRYRGVKIEVHHIIPLEKEGKDTLENAIALCYDCHSDAGHYHAKHPKGSKYSPSELKKHKAFWFKLVSEGKVEMPVEKEIDLIIDGNIREFNPIFLRKDINYIDKNLFSALDEASDFDIKRHVDLFRRGNVLDDFRLNSIETMKDLIEYLSKDNDKRLEFFENDYNSTEEIQPIIYEQGRYFNKLVLHNQSICTLDLKVVNNGSEVLEDYKIYLEFINVLCADSVDKRSEMFDLHKYDYNVHFIDDLNAEFIPNKRILVQKDSINIDSICFKTSHLETEAIIKWKLFARDYNTTGQILIPIRPVLVDSEEIMYVDNPDSYKRTEFIISKIESID